MGTGIADVREHAWGYSWAKLYYEQCSPPPTRRLVSQTVIVTRDDLGVLFCWYCKRDSEIPCEHLNDVLAFRNRTQGTG